MGEKSHQPRDGERSGGVRGHSTNDLPKNFLQPKFNVSIKPARKGHKRNRGLKKGRWRKRYPLGTQTENHRKTKEKKRSERKNNRHWEIRGGGSVGTRGKGQPPEGKLFSRQKHVWKRECRGRGGKRTVGERRPAMRTPGAKKSQHPKLLRKGKKGLGIRKGGPVSGKLSVKKKNGREGPKEEGEIEETKGVKIGLALEEPGGT